MPQPQLILASTSPYRRQALTRLGLPFTAVAPDCDEEALKDPRLAPQDLAMSLAQAKADSIAQRYPQAVIIGSDQLVDFAGEVLGKAGSAAAAEAQLQRLSGAPHRLITAVYLRGPAGVRQHCDITTLHMRPLDAAAIARYVAADRPWDCAGSYRIEDGGMALFSAITTQDHSAITGIPLIALCSLLQEQGIAIP